MAHVHTYIYKPFHKYKLLLHNQQMLNASTVVECRVEEMLSYIERSPDSLGARQLCSWWLLKQLISAWT